MKIIARQAHPRGVAQSAQLVRMPNINVSVDDEEDDEEDDEKDDVNDINDDDDDINDDDDDDDDLQVSQLQCRGGLCDDIACLPSMMVL